MQSLPAIAAEGTTELTFFRLLTGSLLTVTILLVLIIAIKLLRHRGERTVWLGWISFVGLALLPVLTIPLTVGVGIESAKQVSACTSCHVMRPYANDMLNPASSTLAAVHYRNRYIPENQCYTCHTGYGIFGSLRGKFDGLRHLWIYHARDNQTPNNIKLYRPFDFGSCLHCHGHGEAWSQVEDHRDPVTTEAIKAKTMTCFDCHDGSHKVDSVLPK